MHYITYITVVVSFNLSLYAQNFTIGSCNFESKREIYHLYGDKGEEMSLFHDGKKIASLTLFYRSGACGKRIYEETILQSKKEQLLAYTRYRSDSTVDEEERRDGAQVTVYRIDSNCSRLIRTQSNIYLGKVVSGKDKNEIEDLYRATYLNPQAGNQLIEKVDMLFFRSE